MVANWALADEGEVHKALLTRVALLAVRVHVGNVAWSELSHHARHVLLKVCLENGQIRLNQFVLIGFKRFIQLLVRCDALQIF